VADSGPEYAVEALKTAIQGRDAAAVPARRVGAGGSSALTAGDGTGAGAYVVPALDFKFSSPSFLGRRARWVLSLGLLLVSAIALLVAWGLTMDVPEDAGAEWVVPPLMALVNAVFALAFSYAVVMGFGRVELSTKIGEDTAAPAAESDLAIESTTPEADATGVAVNVEVEVTFSHEIDAASLTAQTFLLKAAGGTPVTGSVSVDDDKTTGRFVPSAALSPNTRYEAEITTAVKCATGAALAEGKKWTFTTAA